MNAPERQIEAPKGHAGFKGPIIESHAWTDAAARPLQGAPPALPNPASEFWTELSTTLDEFVAVIGASRERIAELSSEVVKRDSLITLLETQNAALRARLGLAEEFARETTAPYSARTDSATDREPLAAAPAAPANSAGPAGPGPAHSIWHRLTNLERQL